MRSNKKLISEEVKKSKHLMEYGTIGGGIEHEIEEKSYSRIWQHINNPQQTFAIVSAFQPDQSPEQNQKAHQQLRSIISTLHYGYNEMNSGYSYRDEENGTDEAVQEKSFFIPQITKEDAMLLGKTFNQETVLFKDDKMFSEIDPKTGKVVANYATNPNKNMTWNSDVVKRAYSQFRKNNNKNQLKKFAFTKLQEVVIPSRTDAILAMNSNELPKKRYINLI